MTLEVPDVPDIATLFGRDPSDHTNEDIDRIIQKMRDARHLFATEGVRAKAPGKPKLTAKQTGALELKLDIDLDL